MPLHNETAAAAKALSELAAEFRERLDAARIEVGETGFAWYPYDVLAGVTRLEQLLAQLGLTMSDVVGGRPVLDLGCADGDMAFFLESLGCAVTAVDYSGTNFNSMRGAEALKAALASAVELCHADLEADGQWTAPDAATSVAKAPASLALLLGTLHHLRNPSRLLDQLARTADYCFLSTRVARFAPDGTPIGGLPMAYLLDPGESNGDATNYWVFTEPGLRRLIARSGWEICAALNAGDTVNSQPVGAEHDERFYCLLRRRDLFTNGRLLEGWYPPEGARDGWRWTRDRCAVRFAAARCGTVRLRFYVPVERLEATGTFYVGAMLGGEVVASLPVDAPGQFDLDIPVDAPGGGQLELTFWVNPAAGAAGDERILGVIALQAIFYPA